MWRRHRAIFFSQDGGTVVIKSQHSNKLSEKDKEEAKNEVRVLAALSHVNVVRYYECYAGRSAESWITKHSASCPARLHICTACQTAEC